VVEWFTLKFSSRRSRHQSTNAHPQTSSSSSSISPTSPADPAERSLPVLPGAGLQPLFEPDRELRPLLIVLHGHAAFEPPWVPPRCSWRCGKETSRTANPAARPQTALDRNVLPPTLPGVSGGLSWVPQTGGVRRSIWCNAPDGRDSRHRRKHPSSTAGRSAALPPAPGWIRCGHPRAMPIASTAIRRPGPAGRSSASPRKSAIRIAAARRAAAVPSAIIGDWPVSCVGFQKQRKAWLARSHAHHELLVACTLSFIRILTLDRVL